MTQDLKNSDKRLSILTNSERNFIYDIPSFTNQEKKHYFQLNKMEEDIIYNKLRGLNSRIYFILQLGYFKASFRFFKFSFNEVKNDIEYILEKHFPNSSIDQVNITCNKKVRLNHCLIIQNLFSYRFPAKEDKENILTKAQSIVSIDVNPKYIFKEIVRYINNNKIILPAYSSMQKIISKAIITYETELFYNLKSLIDVNLSQNIDDLLQKESEFRYQLTIIKSPPQNFSNKQSVNERKKQEKLKPIFNKAKIILKKLKISNLSIKYFACLVDRYTIQHLCQFDNIKKYFYVLCFVYHRYMKTNDNLIKTFLYIIGKYKNEVKSTIEEKVLEIRLENSRNFKKGATILRLFTNNFDGQLSAQELREKALSILSLDKIDDLANFLEKSNIDFENIRWREYDKKFNKIKVNLRHIFKSLNFTTNTKKNNAHLFEAVEYLQNYLKNNHHKMNDFPTEFIPKNLNKYLFEKIDGQKTIIESRYEMLVYIMLKRKIESSDIFIPDSKEYCSLESDLIDRTYFAKNIKNICSNLEVPFLNEDFEKRIKDKLMEVDRLFIEVNKNIINGKNPYFKLRNMDNKDGKWHLDYQGVENKDINNSIFNKIPKIDLAALVFFINKRTNFFSAFTNILNKNIKSDINNIDLLGAIIAYATNMGIGKLASCSNLLYHQLKRVKDNYLREDTLKSANDIIVNEISKLPIHQVYKINNMVHSSIDGKKYSTGINIFNARYSQKYFGYDKGISVLTLIANFLPIGSRIISPNEYEGNFNLEMLLMNESDIQPQINSTDMHGINELNHALYDFVGYNFQPRYTNIYKQTENIYCLKKPSEYPDKYIIKPSKQINTKLILEEEFNIKHIVTSIMLKTSTVSIIVKKLSSSMKSNKTRKAITEYNKILKTIHILNSINSLEYRQNIQIALNRGESYHQLAGNISYANNGKIMAKTEQEQLIFKECSRLVCNIIIYYNSYILSQFYLEKLRLNQTKQIEALKRISPISWTNVNLYGKYDFDKVSTPISFIKLNELVKGDVLLEEEVVNL